MSRKKAQKLKEIKVEHNILQHRVQKLESILSEIYKEHPEIHYKYCSDWAKENWFDKLEDGTIVPK